MTKLKETGAFESHQIYDLKAEKGHKDKMENEIQNEEVSNESREYLHQSAVKNETINGSFPDKALVKNAEDMGTKLQVENHSNEKNSGYDRTKAITITNEEMDVEISQNEGSSDLVEASEATRDIHEEEETSKTTIEHIEEHVKEVEIEDEGEQLHSPVSATEFKSEEDEDSSYLLSKALPLWRVRTREKIMEKIRRFESLTKLDPVNLDNWMSIDENISSREDDDNEDYDDGLEGIRETNMIFEEQQEEEIHQVEEKAWKLLSHVRETGLECCSDNMDLLFDFLEMNWVRVRVRAVNKGLMWDCLIRQKLG
ncbi:hypothetical protein DKX38_025859 [Salix brachista]|uniref:Uncharacterized protein n=1 Tax=Salix brachista TaxID=2182728 RepID=A0A5N5JVE8_9ROSI|nr:hypothetical protein DKX38_025859 [Salix brachista]